MKYTEEHEWLLEEGELIVVGISAYAAEQLGDVVFVELPEEGTEVTKDEDIVVIESVKAASDILAPLDGPGTKTGFETFPPNPIGYGQLYGGPFEPTRHEQLHPFRSHGLGFCGRSHPRPHGLRFRGLIGGPHRGSHGCRTLLDKHNPHGRGETCPGSLNSLWTVDPCF